MPLLIISLLQYITPANVRHPLRDAIFHFRFDYAATPIRAATRYAMDYARWRDADAAAGRRCCRDADAICRLMLACIAIRLSHAR